MTQQAGCSSNTPSAISAVHLSCAFVDDLIEQRHAVSLGPQADLAGITECRILDLEHALAAVDDPKPVAPELHPQAEPRVGWNRSPDPVTSPAPDDVERAAHAADRLVQDNVILQRIGTHDVIVVRIPDPPDESSGAILGSGDGLELHLNGAV